LSRVAVDAHSKRVTDLIVEKGRVLKGDRVLPVDVVARVQDDGIHLTLSQEEVNACPPYHAADFRSCNPEVHQAIGYHRDESLEWVWRYGLAAAAPFVPTIKERVRPPSTARDADGRPRRVLLGRGSRVYNDEGTIGPVDHLLLDPETGTLRYLVVRHGLRPFRAVIPAEMVGRFEEDGIYVPASGEELDALAHYTPRPDADIQHDVEARLAEENAFDLSRVRVRLADGLVRLAGSVANVLGKRRVQEVAADVPGAVGVENELVTDEEVAARVIAALRADPRTELAPIDVEVDQGRVALRGRVEAEAERQAALTLAREQPGVREVVDQLEVTPTDREGVGG